MTDPLDDLTTALRRATPTPDAVRRADILAQANERYAKEYGDRLQGSRVPGRLNQDRPNRWASLRAGASAMLNTLTSKRGLMTSTALVACVIAVALPDTRAFLFPDTRMPAPEVLETFSGGDNGGNGGLMNLGGPSARDDTTMIPPGMNSNVNALERGLTSATNMAPQTRSYATGRPVADPAAPLIPESSRETFSNAEDSGVRIVSEAPVSTFSIDTDTASYAVVRSSLMSGRLPPKDAVRIEEMINYFPYAYAAPTGDAAFHPTVTVSGTPWNADTKLLKIGLQGALPSVADRPPLNLVFLIDTSGSMNGPNRLGLLVQSFRLMLGQLRPEDEVAIVTYAGSAGVALEPTPASERSTIFAVLETLGAGGSTAGRAGLQQAYAIAEQMSGEDEVSRILLATDGDFNVGISDPDALKDYVAGKRDSGTYLSILGFGRGNLNDATMQSLAQSGNGTAAYIDTLGEAQKVLVDQLTGALFPIADDVKVQVEFNPATVAEYRLIGYETRALRREDFNNDKVDAGEIGAGHRVTALYEVTPIGSPAILNDPLRFGAKPAADTESDDLAFLRLRAKTPGAETSTLTEIAIPDAITGMDIDTGFAAAIAGFGQLLRGSPYLGDWSYADAIALANANTGEDTFGYRREAVSLMRLAETLQP